MPDRPSPAPLGGAAAAQEARLERAIGVRQLTASVINVTVGAGIFALPALVAARMGSDAPLAYLACAGLMAFVVASFAIAGSRVSLTGGIYAYAEVAFGSYVGFLIGVLMWAGAVLSVSSVASALIDAAGAILPWVTTSVGRPLTLAAMFAVLAAVNVRGVRRGAGLVEVMTVLKLFPLLFFVGVGVFFVGGAAGGGAAAPETAGSLGDTVLLLIFAFLGIEVALLPSGEVRDPARTVPRAVFAALGLTTLLYLAVQFVAHGVLGAELARHTATPLAEAAAAFGGPAARSLLLVGAVVSMFGYVTGDMLATPRMLYAFARDGFLPAPFARVDPDRHTPARAIGAHAVLVTALAASGSFERLAVLSNIALLSVYIMCCAAAWELDRRGVQQGGVPFTMPGRRIVPLVAIGIIVWVLSYATAREFAVLGLVLAAASAAYWLRRTGS